MFGFMSVTGFLSMWLSNTATTAMLMPIAYAVVEEMDAHRGDDDTKELSTELLPNGNTGHQEEISVHPPSTRTSSIHHLKHRHSHHHQSLGSIHSIEKVAPHKRHLSADFGYRCHNPSTISGVSLHSYSCLNPTHGGNPDAPQVLYPNANLRPDLQEEEPQAPVIHPNLNVRPDLAEEIEEQMMAHEMRKLDRVSIDKISMASTCATKDKEEEESFKGVSTGLKMAIAFAANIGGTGTLTGTGPNIILKDVLDGTYGDTHGLNFSSWFAFAFPNMVLSLLLAWLWMQIIFLGFRQTFSWNKSDKRHEAAVKKVIHKEYEQLGPITFSEVSVIIFFTLQAVLWFTRQPAFMPGWGSLPFLPHGYVTDACVGMTVACLLFMFPANWPFDGSGPTTALLGWDVVHRKMSWGVVILLGGSFALSDAVNKSGLSNDISAAFVFLQSLSPFLVSLFLSVLTIVITNITSNTATATILLPLCAKLAENMMVSPLYYMLPVTLCSSMAFLLPVSTPPNAIVFAYGDTTILDMMKAGSVLNLASLIMIIVSLNTYGLGIFAMSSYPDWAARAATTTVSFNSTVVPGQLYSRAT